MDITPPLEIEDSRIHLLLEEAEESGDLTR
jgi:hypothetical protein